MWGHHTFHMYQYPKLNLCLSWSLKVIDETWILGFLITSCIILMTIPTQSVEQVFIVNTNYKQIMK
jgi:hypothetical protein